MVPEINLTPQFGRFVARRTRFGAQAVVACTAPDAGQRLNAWLAATEGARIVLGTRWPCWHRCRAWCHGGRGRGTRPQLQSSAKARVIRHATWPYRGRLEGAGCCWVGHTVTGKLAPCTPARPGRMPAAWTWRSAWRGAAPPARRTAARCAASTNHHPAPCVMAPLLAAGRARAARRTKPAAAEPPRLRPVLHCHHWWLESQCPHCSAGACSIKIDRGLRCHHCGLTEQCAPAPECGNADIGTIGCGTGAWKKAWPNCWWTCAALPAPADGAPVRIPDADTTRAQGAHQPAAAVHAGEVDVLVGTQMVCGATTFAASPWWRPSPDGALFSSDYRA